MDQGNEQVRDQGNDQGNEQVRDQGRDQGNEQGNEPAKSLVTVAKRVELLLQREQDLRDKLSTTHTELLTARYELTRLAQGLAQTSALGAFNGEQRARFRASRQPVDRQRSLRSDVGLLRDGSLASRIYEAVEQHPGIAPSEICMKLSAPSNSVRATLAQLKNRGLVYAEGRGHWFPTTSSVPTGSGVPEEPVSL